MIRLPSKTAIGILVGANGLLLGNLGTASASGSMSCTAEDKAITFQVGGGITDGMGGPFFNLEGELEIKIPRVPEDLRILKLKSDDLTHHWLDEQEIKLLFYRERQDDKPHASVQLTIMTKRVGEGDYKGAYELIVYEMPRGERATAKGKIACSVE